MSNAPYQPKLVEIAIGQKLPFRLPGEGAVTHFSPMGVTVFMNMSNPSSEEKAMFKAQQPPRVGVIEHKGVGFLLFRFGHVYKCDASFDAGIEHPGKLPDFDLPAPNSRFLIRLIGVDAGTNVVFGMRLGTLSPRVSRQFARLANRQIANPISRSQSGALVNDAYLKYPKVTDMIRHAIAFDFLGDDDPAPQRPKQGPFF